jgi:hypothetical protein
MFSIPLNPFLSKTDVMEIFLPFVKKYAALIDDIYFTSRIPPFTQDVMGAALGSDADSMGLIRQALFIQQETGVPVGAVFNNPAISPSAENLQLFIQNFDALYNYGIKTITMIQAHWALDLKRYFPEIKIKSSVVRPVTNAQNFIDYARLGYDVIQVDRNLIRNRKELKEIAKARRWFMETSGRNVDISMLANEECRGNCPVQEEHYLYNCHRSKPEEQPYMYTDLSYMSCNGWASMDPAYFFRICVIPPWLENWEDFSNYAQSFKLHGRDNIDLLSNSLKIIKNYHDKKEIIDESRYETFKSFYIGKEDAANWLDKTLECRTQCWSCNICDNMCDKIMKGKEYAENIAGESKQFNIPGVGNDRRGNYSR